MASGHPRGLDWCSPRSSAGKRLRILSGFHQDGRWLFPGFPVLLEPCGILSLRVGAAKSAVHRFAVHIRAADIRTHALFVLESAKPIKPNHQFPRGWLDLASVLYSHRIAFGWC